MTRPRVGMLLVLTILVGLISFARADEKEAAANAKSRMEAAKTVYETAMERKKMLAAQALRPSPSDPEFYYRWSVRWMEAQTEMSEKKEDRVRAAEEHLARMKDVEKISKDSVESAAGKYYRLEAEKWVAERKAK